MKSSSTQKDTLNTVERGLENTIPRQSLREEADGLVVSLGTSGELAGRLLHD